MRKLLFLSLLMAVVHSFATEPTLRYTIETRATDRNAFGKIERWLNSHAYDIAGINLDAKTIEVITDESGVAALNKAGFFGSQSKAGLWGAPDARYLNPTTLEQKLKDLARRYPERTHLEEIGKTLQGRAIYALLVSSTPDPSDPNYQSKPAVLFDAEHHAREVMTPEIVLDVAEQLLSSSDPNMRSYADQLNIWVVPMVNPDGSNLVFTKNSMWRKNARGSSASSIYGVDINRNYDYKWNSCNGSSGSTYAQDYRGASAGSEPETQALMRLADRIHPVAYLSYHSYSELVIYPFGCPKDISPDRDLLERVGNELSALLPKDTGRGNYTVGTAWEMLYAVDGDSMGYMHGKFGALSYTFEVNQDFQPDYKLREPTLKKHQRAWRHFLDRSLSSLVSIHVKDALHPEGARATVAISPLLATASPGPKLKTNDTGMLFKVLDPGAYSVQVTLEDGRSATVQLQMDQGQKALEVQVN